MILIKFLQLVRYKNLLMLFFIQLLFLFTLIDPSFLKTDFQFLFLFSLLTFSIICIAASGNIINDIFDLETDTINKPKKIIIDKYISKKSAFNWYFILNITGLASGIYFFYLLDKISFSLIFIFTILLLYLYSKYLKKIALLGNFTVSFLIALSILLALVFAIRTGEISIQKVYIFYGYAFFAFILNFIREIVKDLEDIDGDYSLKMKTLPIVLGRKRTQYTVFGLAIIPLFSSIVIAFGLFKNQLQLVLYIFTLIIIPLLIFETKINSAKTKNDFHKLSILLKIIMFFGMLSLLLISKII